MIDLKYLEEEIFLALNEKTPKNLLKEYRSTTEGMMQFLLNEINFDYGNHLELGSFMMKGWLKKLTGDLNINADIDYIRLYGNRAIHFGAPKFSDYDIRLVNASYKRVVSFFYSKINKNLPKDINRLLQKLKVVVEQKNIYSNDKKLYLDTLIAVESNDINYPFKGLQLIGNICSKIILDNRKIVPQWMINKEKGYVFVDKAVNYIKKNKFITDERIAQIESLQVFFTSSKNLKLNENNVPKVNDEILESLYSVINWFYKIDTTSKKRIPRKVISTTVDIMALVTFGVTLLLGLSLFNWSHILKSDSTNFTYISIGITAVGVSIFVIAFLFNLFYPYVKALRNRKLYSLSRGLTAFTGTIGVTILGTVSNWLLDDGNKDGSLLTFFIGALSWSVLIQLSLIVKSPTNSKEDKILRRVSYGMILLIVVVSIWFSQGYVA